MEEYPLFWHSFHNCNHYTIPAVTYQYSTNYYESA